MLVLGIESSCDETSLAFLENRESGQILATKDLASYLNSFHLLAQVVLSQIKLHAEYGGVIPELGARQHAEQIHFLFAQTLSQAASKRAELWPMEGRENEGQKEQGEENQNEENGKDLLEKGLEIEILRDLDYIFVTSEPGLVSALRVGMEFAKTIQFFTDIYWQKQVKIQHINHLRGHVASCFRV